jgi:hypothetical protein
MTRVFEVCLIRFKTDGIIRSAIEKSYHVFQSNATYGMSKAVSRKGAKQKHAKSKRLQSLRVLPLRLSAFAGNVCPLPSFKVWCAQLL